MKKITITLLSLIATASFAQTTLIDFESVSDDLQGDVSFDFSFGRVASVDNRFDNPPYEANPSVDDVNSSARVRQLVVDAQNTQGFGGHGIQFKNPFSLPQSSSFLSVLMRCDENNVGVQILLADGETDGMPRHAGFVTYTGNGDWQLLETELVSENSGTGIDYTRVQFNMPPPAGTSDYTMFIDDVIINDLSILSTGDFTKDDVSVYPIPATLAVNIRGEVSGNTASIFDITGSLVATQAITGDFNSVDVSALANGVYFLQLENGSVLRFVK